MTIKKISFVTGLLAALFACTPAANPGANNSVDEAKIIVKEVVNLTPTFIASLEGIEEGDEVKEGETLRLIILPGEVLSSGFAPAHMEHIHVHVGDEVYMPEQIPEGTTLESLEIEFPAPSKSFGVVVAYAVQQQFTPDGYTMFLEENGDGVQLFGVSPNKTYKYFDCYLRTPDAYTIESVEFKVGDGPWEDLTKYAGCRFERTQSLDWVYNVTVRPNYQNVAGDVTLRVKGKQHGRYKIVWKNTESVKTDIPAEWQQNYFPTESIDGEVVIASFYTVDEKYFDGARGYFASSGEGSKPDFDTECIARSYVRFTMPASDVEIYLDFKDKISVSYGGGEHISAAQVYSDRDIYYGVPTSLGIPGEYVYLFANAESGYKPSVASVSGKDYPFVIYGDGIDRYQYYAPVLIPDGAESAIITASAKTAYSVSVEPAGTVVQFESGSTYFAGETVKFTVGIPAGKQIEGVSAKTSGGQAVSVNMAADSPSGSFVMPSSNVTLTVAFSDVSTGNTVHVSAIYDSDTYSVNSSTNYDWKFTETGFDIPTGTTFYLQVYNWDGDSYHVGIKIGNTVNYYEANLDPDMGEYEFGRSVTASGNVTIKVGPSRSAVTF